MPPCHRLLKQSRRKHIREKSLERTFWAKRCQARGGSWPVLNRAKQEAEEGASKRSQQKDRPGLFDYGSVWTIRAPAPLHDFGRRKWLKNGHFFSRCGSHGRRERQGSVDLMHQFGKNLARACVRACVCGKIAVAANQNTAGIHTTRDSLVVSITYPVSRMLANERNGSSSVKHICVRKRPRGGFVRSSSRRARACVCEREHGLPPQ